MDWHGSQNLGLDYCSWKPYILTEEDCLHNPRLSGNTTARAFSKSKTVLHRNLEFLQTSLKQNKSKPQIKQHFDYGVQTLGPEDKHSNAESYDSRVSDWNREKRDIEIMESRLALHTTFWAVCHVPTR